jgi:hypothetical protein
MGAPDISSPLYQRINVTESDGEVSAVISQARETLDPNITFCSGYAIKQEKLFSQKIYFDYKVIINN